MIVKTNKDTIQELAKPSPLQLFAVQGRYPLTPQHSCITRIIPQNLEL